MLHKSPLFAFSFVLLGLGISFWSIGIVVGQEARYQPELENITLDSYLANPRLFNLQVKCLLYDGPCDIVGKFLKPRIAKGLIGECLLCTPKQMESMNQLLVYIQTHKPDLYRLAISKYLQHSGISLSPQEEEKVKNLERKEGLIS